MTATRYGLTLTTASTKEIDAHDANGTCVDIKATTGSRGAASPVWAAAGGMQSNGQRIISLNRLRELQS